MRSTRDFTTLRLSLRLRLECRCSSKLEIPTIIGIGVVPRNSPLPGPRKGSRGGEPLSCPLQDRRYLFAEVGLDHVARLEVLEALEADTAVEAGPHLGHVVLEAPEGRDLPLVHHPVVAQQPDAGGARDDPFDHMAAGDGAPLRNLEGVAPPGPAARHLAEGGGGRPRHRLTPPGAAPADE